MLPYKILKWLFMVSMILLGFLTSYTIMRTRIRCDIFACEISSLVNALTIS